MIINNLLNKLFVKKNNTVKIKSGLRTPPRLHILDSIILDSMIQADYCGELCSPLSVLQVFKLKLVVIKNFLLFL
jgi:hypothetical protein